MTNILIIDDEREFDVIERSISFLDKFQYARNLADAEDFLFDSYILWDRVYLDHDLGNEEEVRSLTNKIEELAYDGKLLNVRKFIIHSQNPVGRMEMYNALCKFYNVEFARVEDLL